MAVFKDYYAILAVPPDASRKQIGTAYDRLARICQPDPQREPLDPQRMRDLDEAFDTLDDPARRAQYDRIWQDSSPAATGQAPDGHDYYTVLGVSPHASREAIAAAYDHLARIYQPHPDLTPDEPNKMGALNEAFDTLDDLVRRAEYDRRRGIAARPEGAAVAMPEARQGPSATSRRRADRQFGRPPRLAIVLIGAGVVAAAAAIALAAVKLTSGSSPLIEVTTASGLKSIDLKIGDGPTPQMGQIVYLDYAGTLADGTKFDSASDGRQPWSFAFGEGEAPQAWEEAIATMKMGGRRRLIQPLGQGVAIGASPSSAPTAATSSIDVTLRDVEPAPLPSPAPVRTPTPSPAAPPAVNGNVTTTDSGLQYADIAPHRPDGTI